MYNYKDKAANIKQLNRYMLAKTLSMFEYMGLPETIPYEALEKMLQENGYAFITKVEGELYAFTGGLGGELDAYYQPTQITIANPWLKLNKTLDVNKDGVLIKNDDMCAGLLDLYTKAHTMMVENDINLTVYGYNTRTQKMISASDDKTRESAEAFLKKAVDGEIAVIGENAIFDGVKLHSASGAQNVTLTNMIEYQQYLKGSLYNEVGLSANFNMKRERLISSEVDQGEDSLFPFVYNMMKCRLKAVEKINAMFDTNISVDFGSVWHFKNKQLVDDVVQPKELPTESQPGNVENVPTPTGTDANSPASGIAEQKAEIERMMLEPDLSDEDKQALAEMLAELEAKE